MKFELIFFLIHEISVCLVFKENWAVHEEGWFWT